MIFVLHADEETAQVVIDGRLFSIPPNTPFEVSELRGNDRNNNGNYEYIIPDHLVAAKIREHAWYHGIVEVPVRREANKIHWDTDSAIDAAREALGQAQDALLAQYVADQQERVKEGKAALPPGGRVATIVERRGIDLKKEFNIDPPGWKLEKMADRDAEIHALKAQNETMQRQLEELMSRLPVLTEPTAEEIETLAKRKR